MPAPIPPDLSEVTSKTVFRATAAVTLITFFSHVLGLGRESAMAGVFGAGSATDAYFVALIVPTVLSAVFIIGLRTVMISLLGEYIYMPEKTGDLRVVVWSMFHLLLFFAVAIQAAVVLIMPSCMRFVAPGFSPEQLEIAIRLVRILSGVIVFNSLSIWAQSVLQVSQKFNTPAASDLFFNATMISAIFLSGWRGGIEGVAWGMLAATAVQFFVQLPAALRSVPSYQAVCDLKHPTVRRLAAQTVPVGIRVAAHMVNHLVERSLASKLATGSISALNFSFMVVQIPISIFGAPLVTVLNSVMAAFHSTGDADRYRRALVRGIRMISVVFIPITMILILYRADCVQLLFQRGAFDQAAANLTATALAYYALGLLFFVWRAHAIQSLIALKDFVTPVWTTLVAIAANVACNLTLVGPMDIGGIALGRSIGEVVWVLCLMGQLRRRLGPLGGLDILKSCGQIVLASAVAATLGYALRFSSAADQAWMAMDAWATAAPGTAWALPGSILFRLSILGTIYIAVYTALCKWMKVAEADELIDLVRGYLKKG